MAAASGRQERITLGIATTRRKISNPSSINNLNLLSATGAQHTSPPSALSGLSSTTVINNGLPSPTSPREFPRTNSVPESKALVVVSSSRPSSIATSSVAGVATSYRQAGSPQSLQTPTLASIASSVQRKLSEYMSPTSLGSSGTAAYQFPFTSPTLGRGPPTSLLVPGPSGNPLNFALRSPLSPMLLPLRSAISIRIDRAGDTSLGGSLAGGHLSLPLNQMQLGMELLSVDTPGGIDMNKHSTSARITNLRAQAKQLRRLRYITQRRPAWLVRLINGTFQFSICLSANILMFVLVCTKYCTMYEWECVKSYLAHNPLRHNPSRQ